MWGDIAIAFLLAFITAFMTTPKTIKLAKKIGAIDLPKDERRINTAPMPRLGGIAVIIGFIVSITYLLVIMSIEKTIDLNGPEKYYKKLIGFFIGMAIITVTCYIDDIKGVKAIFKLIAQTIAAIIVVSTGTVINIKWSGDLNISQFLDRIITIGWIVGITNAINLIDGLDGLSSGISLISCLSLIIIFSLNQSPIIAVVLITALAGAITGFLPFNFNPAKTFIGDTGSNFLGYVLSIISIWGIAKKYTIMVIVAPLIVLALPVFDTIFAILRRLKKGKSLKAIITPDAGHLHHKIIRQGFSQRQAVFMLYGASASFGMFAIILLDSGVEKAISFGLTTLIVILLGYENVKKFMIEEAYKCPKCGYEYERYDENKYKEMNFETTNETMMQVFRCPKCGEPIKHVFHDGKECEK